MFYTYISDKKYYIFYYSFVNISLMECKIFRKSQTSQFLLQKQLRLETQMKASFKNAYEKMLYALYRKTLIYMMLE